MTKPTKPFDATAYRKEIEKRDAEYREVLKSEQTSFLLRLLYDENYQSISHWQSALIDEEIDARIPPRKP